MGGSDGIFDNLFLDEISDLCNKMLPASQPLPTPTTQLSQLGKCMVDAAHRKSKRGLGGQLSEAPIGRGGKMDDTSVVVAEVVEWTECLDCGTHISSSEALLQSLGTFLSCETCCVVADEDSEDDLDEEV